MPGGFRLLRRPPRQCGGDPLTPRRAGLHPGTQRAGGRGGRTQRCAQIEQRLREVTRTGARVGIAAQYRRRGAHGGPYAGQGIGQREQAGRDTLHIGIDRHGGDAEPNRGHGVGGVDANARQCQQTGDGARKSAQFHHRAGAGVQVPRPRVIAKPGPQAQHRVQIGGGERLDRGKPAYEGFIIGYDGGDGRLLQHDLAEPDPVRIGRPPRDGAPGQVAAMTVVPGEQSASGEDASGKRDGKR